MRLRATKRLIASVWKKDSVELQWQTVCSVALRSWAEFFLTWWYLGVFLHSFFFFLHLRNMKKKQKGYLYDLWRIYHFTCHSFQSLPDRGVKSLNATVQVYCSHYSDRPLTRACRRFYSLRDFLRWTLLSEAWRSGAGADWTFLAWSAQWGIEPLTLTSLLTFLALLTFSRDVGFWITKIFIYRDIYIFWSLKISRSYSKTTSPSAILQKNGSIINRGSINDHIGRLWEQVRWLILLFVVRRRSFCFPSYYNSRRSKGVLGTVTDVCRYKYQSV